MMSALVAFIHDLAARTAFAMHDFVPAFPLFAAFLVASFVLAVTPGPGVFYIVARSLAQGRLSRLASVAGVALGNMGNAIGASIYALTAGAVRPWLQHAKGVGSAGRYLTGGAFIGLGILAAFSGQRAKP